MGCKWKEAWRGQFSWIKPVAGNPSKVSCSACEKELSCEKGVNDLKKHDKNVMHTGNVERKKGDAKNGVKVQTIQESMKNAASKLSEERKVKDAALKAEAALSNLMATHNLPMPMFDCLAELLPKIIPDSKIIKQMTLHRTKAHYTLVFGTAPHMKEQLIKQLQIFPFSINYDESVKGKASQLELNVSYRDTQGRIRRSHLITIKMEERLTGKNISSALFQAMDKMNIPYEKGLVSERTDGCATMLGVFSGCHVLNKKVVPQLPDLGGCSCHDACNCLKAGMKAMNYELASLWRATFPCLEKASVKKTLHFKEICEELGQVYKHVPKYLDVRFRYTVKLALFFEENDLALYSYFKEIADR
jgi:hypothetical protein